MKLYNLDKRYKKFIETLVDGYVKGKSNMENGSNPYISEPGMLFNSMFYDFTNDYGCNLIFHKTEDNYISVCYVFDSRLIKDESADKYEAQEKFINIQCSDFIYKLSLLKWLEDSGDIILIDDTSSNLSLEGKITEHDRQRWENNGMLCREKTIKSKSVYETVSRYYNCRIIPSAQLIDIRENGFKTLEQRRFEEQLEVANDTLVETKNTLAETKKSLETSQEALKVSYRSFWIALVTLLGTILFGLYQSCSQQEIDSEQINTIISSIKEEKSISIDKFPDILPDTLNVKVTDTPEKQPINLNVTVKENQPTKIQ